MITLALILGFILGIAISYWRIHKLNSQLKQMLITFSDSADLTTALPAPSLVRRELAELYQTKQKLAEELEQQKNILEQSPTGYLEVDRDNQLLWCNQQARQLLNIDRWQPGQVRLLLELVRSYELDQLIEKTRTSQSKQVREWRYYLPQYAKDYQLSNSPPVFGQSVALKAFGLPLNRGKVGIFLENKQPLVELSRNRDRAFSDLTHELRTPLTSISLLAETLQKRLENPERSWADQILKEIERLMNLVQDWLEISRLQEDPSQYLNCESFNLRDLILGAWKTLIPLAQQKKITLKYTGKEEIILVADRAKLTQVFVNLFDNGIKHSPEGSLLRVEVANNQAQINNQEIVIDIIDYGDGFREEDLPYVFERLYRGESSRSREPSENSRRGSGLGLAIVKQFIQAHGGTVEAKNHPETKGAWIRLKLLGKFPLER